MYNEVRRRASNREPDARRGSSSYRPQSFAPARDRTGPRSTPRGTPVAAPGGGGGQWPGVGPGAARHSSASFLHNARLWVLGAPSLALLLLCGGRPLWLTASLAAMVWYCFDAADNKEGAMLALWGGVLSSAGALSWTTLGYSSGGYTSYSYNQGGGGATAAAMGAWWAMMRGICLWGWSLEAGVWATLQYGWLRREEPVFYSLLEMLVVGLFPPLCAVVVAWGAAAALGVHAAAPALALSLFTAKAVFSGPLQALELAHQQHDRSGGSAPSPAPVPPPSGPATSIARGVALALVSLPPLVQAIADHRLLKETVLTAITLGGGGGGGAGAGGHRHVMGGGGGAGVRLGLAVVLPWALLWWLAQHGEGGLWWAGEGAREDRGREVRRRRGRMEMVVDVAGPVALACLAEAVKSLALLPALRPYLAAYAIQGTSSPSSSSPTSAPAPPKPWPWPWPYGGWGGRAGSGGPTAATPPWDSLLLSAALYALAGAVFVRGWWGPGGSRGGREGGGGGGGEGSVRGGFGGGGKRARLASRALAVVSMRCLGRLVGVGGLPQLALDLSALSVAAFVDERKPWQYLAGLAGVCGAALWLARRALWHLDYRFVLRPGHADPALGAALETVTFNVSLRAFTIFAVGLGATVLLVPGLLVLRAPPPVVAVLISVHAVGLAAAESMLMGAGGGRRGEEDQSQGLPRDAYPVGLAALTAALGLLSVWRLGREWRLEPVHLWVAGCLHGGKLLAAVVASLSPRSSAWGAGAAGSGLLPPEGAFARVFIPMAALTMAFTAPAALYPSARTPARFYTSSGGAVLGGGGAADVDGEAGAGPGRREAGGGEDVAMLPEEGVLCAVFACFALWHASGPVVSPLLGGLLGGGADQAPSPLHVTAACGLALGAFILGMVGSHFRGSVKARRLGTAVLLTSLAAAAVPKRAGPGTGDAGALLPWGWMVFPGPVGGIQGGGVQQRLAGWLAATAAATAAAGLLAATGIAPALRLSTLPRRTAFSLSFGGGLGAWAALSALPPPAAVWAAPAFAATLAAAALLLLLQTAPPGAWAAAAAVAAAAPAGSGRGGAAGLAGSWWRVHLWLYAVVVAAGPAALLGQVVHDLAVPPPPGAGRVPGGGLPALGGVPAAAAGFAAVWRVHTSAVSCAHAAIALGLGGWAAGGGGGSHGGRYGSRAAPGPPPAATEMMASLSAILASAGAALLVLGRSAGGTGLGALLAAAAAAAVPLLLVRGGVLGGVGGGHAGCYARQNHARLAAPLVAACSVVWGAASLYSVAGRGCRLPGKTPVLGQQQAPSYYHAHHGALDGGNTFRGFGGDDHRSAAALRAVSLCLATSMWRPLWNLLLLALALPAHARLVGYLSGRALRQRTPAVLLSMALATLPLATGDLASIRLMGALGLGGGSLHVWLARRQRRHGMRVL